MIWDFLFLGAFALVAIGATSIIASAVARRSLRRENRKPEDDVTFEIAKEAFERNQTVHWRVDYKEGADDY